MTRIWGSIRIGDYNKINWSFSRRESYISRLYIGCRAHNVLLEVSIPEPGYFNARNGCLAPSSEWFGRVRVTLGLEN